MLGDAFGPMDADIGATGPEQAPEENTSFDVRRNPQDMQVMTDAMMYAPMLKEMDEDQREQNWPQIVNKLKQVNPKVGTMLDPSLPPDDKALDRVLQQMPQPGQAKAQTVGYDRADYSDAMLKRQMEGQQPISRLEWMKQQREAKQQQPEGEMSDQEMDDIVQGAQQEAQLGTQKRTVGLFDEDVAPAEAEEDKSSISKPLKRKVRENLMETTNTLHELFDVYEGWDDSAFTYRGDIEEWIAKQKDKLEISNEDDVKLLQRRVAQHQRIGKIMLLWRKHITGVAGGEKEMNEIKKTILNEDLSPAEARKARDILFRKTLRDAMTQRKLLQAGIVPEGKSDKDYTKNFQQTRKLVDQQFDEYIRKFKKANEGASATDALMYMQYKQRMAK